jgi:hypothetical protein
MSKAFSWFRSSLFISIIGTGLYFVYKRVSKERLNKWLEEYIQEIEKEIEEQKKDILSIKTIIKIFNLITLIEDFLYNKDYESYEAERLKLFKTDSYEDSVLQCLDRHEICFKRAKIIVERRLKVNILDINEAINKHPANEIKRLLESTKRPFPEIPITDRETLKKAYLQYSRTLIEHDKINKNNILLSQAKPGLSEMTKRIFIINKYVAKDYLKINYGIDEKYLGQLLEACNLLDDEEIKANIDELKSL